MEKVFSASVLDILSKHFFIEKEVFGTHFSGCRLRIDAVVKPKETSMWKNKNVAFGIEFKAKEKLDGLKASTHWVKQCIDYANTQWDSYGYIYVFSCPNIFEKDDEIYLNRILSDLGVGVLRDNNYHGWTFYLQDRHRIWSEKDGICEGKKWSLIRKFGRDSFRNFEN